MSKRENIYAHADEKFVKTTMLYANGSKELFYDEATTAEKVKKADLTRLFLAGVTIVLSGVYYKPVCLKEAGLIAYDGTTTALTFTAEADAE